MKFNVTQMDRRFFLGGAAVVAGTAVAGGLPMGAKALLQPASAPVVAVFMDMPFVDTSGQHAAYRPPLAFAHDHFEPHFHI